MLLSRVFIFKDCILPLAGTRTTVTMVDASLCLSDIVSNTRKLSQAWYAHHDTWLTESVRGKLKIISELLCIKHHYLKLDLFKADEVNVVIDVFVYYLR